MFIMALVQPLLTIQANNDLHPVMMVMAMGDEEMDMVVFYLLYFSLSFYWWCIFVCLMVLRWSLTLNNKCNSFIKHQSCYRNVMYDKPFQWFWWPISEIHKFCRGECQCFSRERIQYATHHQSSCKRVIVHRKVKNIDVYLLICFQRKM